MTEEDTQRKGRHLFLTWKKAALHLWAHIEVIPHVKTFFVNKKAEMYHEGVPEKQH